MTEPIKLLLVDDHELFLEGIVSLLEDVEGLEIVGRGGDGLEAIELIAETSPDIILADLNMPNMNGTELVKHVKKHNPEIKIIVLTMHDDRPTVTEIMMAEAEGYVLKNTDRKELVTAITRVANGSTYYCNEVMSIILDKYKEEKRIDAQTVQLTDREQEILQLIALEKSNEEIAEQLYISRRTVETHRKNILKKTEVKGVVGLLKYGYRMGWIVL
ncbi:MAG: response regulator transcription factor [Cyclobacteriaceae bacterium]